MRSSLSMMSRSMTLRSSRILPLQGIVCSSASASSSMRFAGMWYSAQIVSAVKKAAALVKKGDLQAEDIDAKMFSEMLYTQAMPDPDLVIRTSGEQRVSNYLLWQIAYSELFFTKTLWPDFNKDELTAIINDFKTRERRYGKN